MKKKQISRMKNLNLFAFLEVQKITGWCDLANCWDQQQFFRGSILGTRFFSCRFKVSLQVYVIHWGRLRSNLADMFSCLYVLITIIIDRFQICYYSWNWLQNNTGSQLKPYRLHFVSDLFCNKFNQNSDNHNKVRLSLSVTASYP